jgi:cellulose synthase/poly-beta-1,6-N-acetylglucosamine synthase-like glycosyltransferase
MTVLIIQATLGVIALMLLYDFYQQTSLVTRFLYYLHRERNALPAAGQPPLPRAAVILSLRGPDPQLKDTLRALLMQDYPDFQVQIVVDSDQDPVLRDVREIQDSCQDERLVVSVLRNPSRTCSLKCSSLIQAVQELDPDVEVLAFIDGDAVPQTTWLKELVLPLARGEADVAGGNRWYLPPRPGLGAMCRYFWNVPFLTGMWDQGAPWAGTMALRRTTAERVGLLQEWSTAMSVDATLHRCMRIHGLRFKLVESLLMPNREDITLKSFNRWVARQMTVIRYSVSAAVRVAQVQLAILSVSHTVLPALAITAFAIGATSSGWFATGMLATYWVTCSLRAMLIEMSIRVSLQRRGEQTQWMRPITILLWCPWLAITHYVVGTGLLIAVRLKQVDWRGIQYRLSRNGVVRMLEYRPYTSEWIRTDNNSVV